VSSSARAVGLVVALASLAVLAGSLGVVALALRGSGAAARGETAAAVPRDRGAALYQRYCEICHGERGDGMGPSAPFLWPPPRDFRTAQFKFTGTPEGALAHDDDLTRVVRRGLAGTAMQPWDVPDAELTAILQHIKSFSPAGRGYRDPLRRAERSPPPPSPAPTPDLEDPAALAEAARLYHAVLQCNQCHPSYVRPAELAAWNAPVRPIDPLDPVPKWSATYRTVLLPPDFLRHPLRSIQTGPGPALDHDPVDLHRIIAHGMAGPMPGYGHLDPAWVWSVVSYTKWLADQRDTEAGRALHLELEAAWEPE
jgi:mono/diheme cytochrome c family protein